MSLVWYVALMSHMTDTSHTEFPVRLGDRGRLVLPSAVSRALGLEPGDELVARVEGESVRLVSRRSLARGVRGTLTRRVPDRDLVGELLAERQAEAERE